MIIILKKIRINNNTINYIPIKKIFLFCLNNIYDFVFN